MKRFQNKRMKELATLEQAELMKFQYKFYRENMWWIHRKLVTWTFFLKWYWLSSFIQSFAAFSITNVSTIPPQVDIYSFGSWRNGVGCFYWRRGNLILADLLCHPQTPIAVDKNKKLIASNYREVSEKAPDSEPISEKQSP
ncbi:hypothetical protein [Leptospira sp. GIMC2001]|uniref:hypothetical protein n=1 Tax=Leptospira sp. GIMC2001 TaxID=1513297 RepID=UPI00234B4A9D|nr:hypothetical protein [Leptospira sp. GIMC2001]WCL51509.1 hypothetical protein O4O04_20040 [Leptospira sp. GIMC2001]